MRSLQLCNCGMCKECRVRARQRGRRGINHSQEVGNGPMHGYPDRPKGMVNRNKHNQPGTKKQRIW